MGDLKKVGDWWNRQVSRGITRRVDGLVDSLRRLEDNQALADRIRELEGQVQAPAVPSPPIADSPSSPPVDPPQTSIPSLVLQPAKELSFHEQLQLDGTKYTKFYFRDFKDCFHDQLGRGGQAAVFLQNHPIFGTVALKLFNTTSNDKYKKREMINIMKLQSHPGVVRLFGFLYANEDSEDVLGYVMERVNTSLSEVIGFEDETKGKYDYTVAQAVRWMSESAACFAFTHENNVMHRDIKPHNILVAWDHPGKPIRVCDFGLSKDLLLSKGKMSTKIGSPFYMPPEIMHLTTCEEVYDEAADVYSLALTFWELLHRRHVPSLGCNQLEEFYAAVTKGAKRPPIDDGCPAELAELLRRCWTAEVKSRPSMLQLKEELEKLNAEYPEWQNLPVGYTSDPNE